MASFKVLWLTLLICAVGCQQKKSKPKFVDLYDTQSFAGAYRPQVTILGTFHFTNAALHDYQDQYTIDSNTKQRQEELKILIERLKAFKPTKILIEADRIAYDSVLNVQYAQYSRGEAFDLNDERYQIAFPLANAMNHEHIYCSDAAADWFGADLDWQNFDEEHYLRSMNQYDKSNRYDYERVYEQEDSLKSVMPLLEYFQLINDPQAQHYSHQIYLTETVLSGAGDNYIGADAVARWYRRNLRIFSNLLDIVSFEEPERILILYGASHTWTLKQFLKDSPDFEYIEVNEFLSKQP